MCSKTYFFGTNLWFHSWNLLPWTISFRSFRRLFQFHSVAWLVGENLNFPRDNRHFAASSIESLTILKFLQSLVTYRNALHTASSRVMCPYTSVNSQKLLMSSKLANVQINGWSSNELEDRLLFVSQQFKTEQLAHHVSDIPIYVTYFDQRCCVWLLIRISSIDSKFHANIESIGDKDQRYSLEAAIRLLPDRPRCIRDWQVLMSC